MREANITKIIIAVSEMKMTFHVLSLLTAEFVISCQLVRKQL